jgi:hypothetical protein
MRLNRGAFALAAMLFASTANASEITPYDFPVDDPLVATVLGTPPDYQHPYAKTKKLHERYYRVNLHKPGLERFRGQRRRGSHRLEFSLAFQKGPAPLVVSIAGTGGDHASGKALLMKKLLYSAGYHVLSMTSPTNAEFIFGASSTNLAGMTPIDVADLYRAIRAALERIGDKIEVTAYYLTGYSLGGLESAFLSKLDDEEGKIGFKKVLLINPPVNLYTSVSNLSFIVKPGELVDETGSRSLRDFMDNLFSRIAEYFKREGSTNLDGDALYAVAEGVELSDFELRALVRIAFGFSVADMVFVSDMMNETGYVAPNGASTRMLTGEVTTWFKRSLRWNFLDYFYLMVLPYWQTLHPEDTEEDAIRKWSLFGIDAYLRRTAKISVMHNVDDIILGEGDIDYLRETFGDRAYIYPRGGHCGNMDFARNVDDMIAFFEK